MQELVVIAAEALTRIGRPSVLAQTLERQGLEHLTSETEPFGRWSVSNDPTLLQGPMAGGSQRV